MNNCTLYGRLGGDSELHYSKAGKPFLKFSLANNTGFGENKKTNWFSCTLFGDRGIKLQAHLLKGAAVVVSGEVTLNTWTSEGVEHSRLSLTVREVSLVGGKPEGESKTSRPAPEASSLDFDDSEIPF